MVCGIGGRLQDRGQRLELQRQLECIVKMRVKDQKEGNMEISTWFCAFGGKCV